MVVVVLYGDGSKLYKVKLGTDKAILGTNLAVDGVQNIIRLAISRNKLTIAVVANDEQ